MGKWLCTRCSRPLAPVLITDPEFAPGDISICSACGHVSIFAVDMHLRDPIPREMMALRHSAAWPYVKALQSKFRQAKADEFKGYKLTFKAPV